MMLSTESYPIDRSFPKDLERYLRETLHTNIQVTETLNPLNIPTFLERSYRFFETHIVNRKCVFIAANEEIATPTNIAKHTSLVQSAVDAIVIFATPSLSANKRARMTSLGVSFVVPGNQLYIPGLAMDLREYYRAPKSSSADGLSPAAQAVLFSYLQSSEEFVSTPSVIAERLHYSPMSIGRAFDDLVVNGLAETRKRGRERHIHFFQDKRQLLDSAQSKLRSPVQSIKYVVATGRFELKHGIEKEMKRAGESALAQLTDLAPPQYDSFAMAASDWKSLLRRFELEEVNEFEQYFVVETWFYDPAGLSKGPFVDPLSLYAQFINHPDERVSMAAEELLNKIQW